MEEPAEAKELMGWLAFAFLATYMLLCAVFAAMASWVPRWWLIAGVWWCGALPPGHRVRLNS
jgi:hypothetical protein